MKKTIIIILFALFTMHANIKAIKNTTKQIPNTEWTYTTEGEIWSSPALGDVDEDGKLEIIIGNDANKVYCLNGENGSVLWTGALG